MRRRIILFAVLAVVAVVAGVVHWNRVRDAPRGGGSGGGRQAASSQVLEPVRFLQGHLDGVHAVEFSPDGSLLLTGSHDGTARLWDVAGGKEVRSFYAHAGAVLDADFSPDGKRIVTAGDDGKVMVWDAGTGDLLSILEGPPRCFVFAAAILPDGSVLSADSNGEVRRWNVDEETPADAMRAHRGAVHAMDVSADGTRAVSGGADGRLVCWDLAGGTPVWQAAWPGGPGGSPPVVRSIAISPDGGWVYAAANGRSPEAWDAKTGAHARSLSGGPSGALALSKDGSKMLLAAEDGLTLWDPLTSSQLLVFTVPEHRVSHAVALSPDGRWAVMGRGGYYGRGGAGWVRADDPRVPVWEVGEKK